MTRARLLAAVVAVTAVCSGESVFRAQSVTYDVVIRGGHIVDGNGNPWFAGDVGIRNGRVAAIGKLDNAPATRVIDAAGRIVAPGFIDLHTHSDLSVLADPLSQSKVRQGVTLDVLGESTSVAPRDGLTDPQTDGITQDWTTFTEYFSRVESKGVSINLISHVSADKAGRQFTPQSAARVVGMRRVPHERGELCGSESPRREPVAGVRVVDVRTNERHEAVGCARRGNAGANGAAEADEFGPLQ